MGTALLLVDGQNAFFDGLHGPPVWEASALLSRLGLLLGRARLAGVPVVFVQHDEAGSEFDPGSPSWELHPELAPLPAETVVRKTTPDSFLETRLRAVLERLGARHLVVAGNQTEFCIDTTCRRARGLGFQVSLVGNGHGTWDGGGLTAAQIVAHHNRVLGIGFTSVLEAEAVRFGASGA